MKDAPETTEAAAVVTEPTDEWDDQTDIRNMRAARKKSGEHAKQLDALAEAIKRRLAEKT